MTVKQLIDILNTFSPDLPIYRFEDYDCAAHSVLVEDVSIVNDSACYGHRGDADLPKIMRVEMR